MGLFILLGITLPWLLGSCAYLGLATDNSRHVLPKAIGHGFVIGMFFTTLLIRLYIKLEIPVTYVSVTAAHAVLLVTIIGALRPRWRFQNVASTRLLSTTEKVLIGLLTIIIIYRGFSITYELIEKPLFAWDAWMNWAPKAIVWFELGNFVPFVRPEAWLVAPDSSNAYTLGNAGASNYPLTVPLIQFWMMTILEDSNSTSIYLPWAILPFTVALAMYGHLRSAHTSASVAVIGCYLLVSIPYGNLQVALPGYADIWLSAGFAVGVFALYDWFVSESPSHLFLALLYAMLCTTLKVPGLILGAIILATAAYVAFTKKFGVRVVQGLLKYGLILLVIAIFAALVAGDSSLTAPPLSLPYLGTLSFSYHDVANQFLETLFLSSNWNIIWYLCLLCLSIQLLSQQRPNGFAVIALPIGLSLIFIYFVFFWTKHYIGAIEFTSVNRALMYPVFAMVFLLSISLAHFETCSSNIRCATEKK